jgi:hypothetical protein
MNISGSLKRRLLLRFILVQFFFSLAGTRTTHALAECWSLELTARFLMSAAVLIL